MTSTREALQSQLSFSDPVCYTDSKVALYWIRGCNQEWKPFVENRVTSIRASVPAQHWKHCPGRENPADIPSRGMSASELLGSDLWLNGPDWLSTSEDLLEGAEVETTAPEECRQEMKSKNAAHSLLTSSGGPRIGQLIDCENFSSLDRLLRVTALVLKFTRLLCQKVKRTDVSDDSGSQYDLDQARLLWIRESQSRLEGNKGFHTWKRQFDLFVDDSQLWRCRGRLSNSNLPSPAQMPILLDKDHYLTTLIVLDAHQRVMHNGVKETLTELRSNYWVVRGRQFIRKLIHQCLVCRRLEGRPFQSAPPPPLPEYRVRQSRPFCYNGVDFAGPLYVKPSVATENPKVWLCLYTCCVTTAVHLDLVPDLNAVTFIRSFKRFTARRGIPTKVVSDNGKTSLKSFKVCLMTPMWRDNSLNFV